MTQEQQNTQQQQYVRTVNAIMTYTNQIDPLVPANEASLEVWAQAMRHLNMDAAKHVIRHYYATIEPHKREPITPGFIRRKTLQLMAKHLGSQAYCQEHNWNYRNACPECKSEVSAGIRRKDQIGEQIKNSIPAPAEVMQQVKQLAASKSVTAEPAADNQSAE